MDLPDRIAVIGPPGSGKTTLAHDLADRLGIAHIELDAIQWGPNWTEATREELRAGAKDALRVNEWVVDGNYGAIRDLVWGRADTVIWLDYPLPIVQFQLFKRTMRRLLRREVLWNGNIERWRDHFLSTDSLFLYTIKSTYRNRRRFPLLFNTTKYSHLRVIVMHTPGETRNWLPGLESRLRHTELRARRMD